MFIFVQCKRGSYAHLVLRLYAVQSALTAYIFWQNNCFQVFFDPDIRISWCYTLELLFETLEPFQVLASEHCFRVFCQKEIRKTIYHELCHLDLVNCTLNHEWENWRDDVKIFVNLEELFFWENKYIKWRKIKWQTFMQSVQIQTVQLTQYKVAANQIVHCKISTSHQLFTRHWPTEIIIIRITSIIIITVNLISRYDFVKYRRKQIEKFVRKLKIWIKKISSKGYRSNSNGTDDSTTCKTTLYFPGTDSMSNRENENQPQSYSIPAPIILSPTNQSGNVGGIFNSDLDRKPYDFSTEQIQCLCEALQQRGDIEKLAMLLYNLPRSELVRPNESILR